MLLGLSGGNNKFSLWTQSQWSLCPSNGCLKRLNDGHDYRLLTELCCVKTSKNLSRLTEKPLTNMYKTIS